MDRVVHSLGIQPNLVCVFRGIHVLQYSNCFQYVHHMMVWHLSSLTDTPELHTCSHGLRLLHVHLQLLVLCQLVGDSRGRYHRHRILAYVLCFAHAANVSLTCTTTFTGL
jgi:hypothetical protein